MSQNSSLEAAGQPVSKAPACADDCAGVVRGILSNEGIEANVSWVAPTFATAYEPLNCACPHGVTWYAEPTTDQIAEWVRDGVE